MSPSRRISSAAMKNAILIGAIAIGTFGAKAEPPPAQPKQGAELLKTDILGVFAHPDDETGMAATLCYYALGKSNVVANVYCTRGEGGGNMVGTQAGAALAVLREAELRECLAQLGVHYCYFLDQLDWAYTESLAATLRKWGKEETLGRLVRLVRALRPEVIVTMNPAPAPGQHGHHQAAAVLATEAYAAAANPARFPEQLSKEGLAVWQVRKVYYGGGGTGTVASIITTNALPGGKTPAEIAAEALANHRSQAFGSFGNSPWLRRPQSFTLIKSVVPFVGAETDLLRGLPLPEADQPPLPIVPPITRGPPVAIQFVPRPAIANYRHWTREQQIEHAAAHLPADVPVVAAEANQVKLEVSNQSGQPSSGRIQIAAPGGWLVNPATKTFRVPPAGKELLSFEVTPPGDSLKDAELTARTQVNETALTAVARAHPVPRLKVARLRAAPPLDGTGQGWENIPEHLIPPTNLVQGKVADENDSSARFRVAHDGRALYIDVAVKDDVVISNIAPNDIKGHWRSDSVEICLDPAGGAEDTMRCFKAGIFTLESTGRVRAARDADANQGPIEETAPNTRLVSRRTPDGYRIQAAIPFSEIGVSPAKDKRLGFNLIIYDGDKRDAAPGENINKSRIAWAPRSGVQGRPEDWGRIDLE